MSGSTRRSSALAPVTANPTDLSLAGVLISQIMVVASLRGRLLCPDWPAVPGPLELIF
jgi:hypothetical protein